MPDNNSSILAALRGADPDGAMAFGQAAAPQGAAVLNTLQGIMSIPKHLIDASANAVPGLRREDYTDNPGAPQPNQPMYDAAADTAMNLAGVGMPAAEAGAAGIFGGQLARTADHGMLNRARYMTNMGKAPEEVRQATGWFQHPTDGQWRFEIPDEKSRLNYLSGYRGNNIMAGPASAMLDHPELFKAYPDLGKLRLEARYEDRGPHPSTGLPDTGSGLWDPRNTTIQVNAPDLKVGRSVALHEMQHAVQTLEGFAPGAEPRFWAELQQKNSPHLSADNMVADPRDLYHRTAGEVEARNVMKRMDMSPLRRFTSSPYNTQDVPFAEQLPIKGADPKYLIEALRGKR